MKLLEAGQIVNTHGIQGEVKIVPWADSAEFLCSFDTVYIDEKPVKFLSAKPHKKNVIARLEGVKDINDAMRLKNKVVSIDRDQVELPDGRHFLADLMGLEVRDAETGAVLGKIVEILTPPSHEVYVVHGEKQYMIPAVDEFVKEVDVEGGFMLVKLIEGMDL